MHPSAGSRARALWVAACCFFSTTAFPAVFPDGVSDAAPGVGQGMDLGVWGKLYPIAEPDLAASIEERLAALDMHSLRRAARARARAYLEQGPPGVELPRARHGRVRYLDPSVSLAHPLHDASGRLLAPAGTRVNPLDYRPFNRRLLFFDAHDPRQREWVRRRLATREHRADLKLVLTAGAPAPLRQDWKQPLYFDQHGLLCRRLGIQALPSQVTREGRRLRVEEFPL